MKNFNVSKSFLLRVFVALNLLMISLFAYSASNSINQAVNDTTITAQVKAKYVQNSLLSVFDISV